LILLHIPVLWEPCNMPLKLLTIIGIKSFNCGNPRRPLEKKNNFICFSEHYEIKFAIDNDEDVEGETSAEVVVL
jgi:hypothetical protein